MGIETDRFVELGFSLQRFQDRLNENSIDYRIIGGLATRSYLNNFREGFNGSLRNTDVDLLVPRADYVKLKSEVVKNAIDNIDGVKYDLSISKYIDFRPKEEFSFLIFRDIKVPVRSGLFEAREVSLNNYKLKTVSPLTLFHTFSVCGGILRPKDWEKILPLGRYIRLHPDDKFKESDYLNFHSFLDIRKELYPQDVWFLGIMQILLSYSPSFCENVAWKVRKRILKSYFGSSKSWGQNNPQKF